MFLDKEEMVAMHEREFAAWESLLAGLAPAQRTDPSLPDGLSVQDTLAHLAAWQQRTIARLEAALHGHEPRFPHWPVALEDEESSEAVDRANAWILETNRNRPWSDVHQEWRNGFLRFLELMRATPEAELRPAGKLAWLAEYELLDAAAGVYDYHHAEHRVQLAAWVANQADAHGPA
jgi:hypothetical protein